MEYNLMFGCLGNGTTVFNRASMRNGDYENIAHIGADGLICWYVRRTQLPKCVVEEIETHAVVVMQGFKEHFFRLSRWDMLGTVYDIMYTRQYVYETGYGKQLADLVPDELYSIYVRYACANGNRTVPGV